MKWPKIVLIFVATFSLFLFSSCKFAPEKDIVEVEKEVIRGFDNIDTNVPNDENLLLHFKLDSCQNQVAIDSQGQHQGKLVFSQLVHRMCGDADDPIEWDGGFDASTGRRFGWNLDNSNEYCMRSDHPDNGRMGGYVYTSKCKDCTSQEVRRARVMVLESPEWLEGFIGTALNFKGKNYIEVRNSTALKVTGSITMSAWIKSIQGGMIISKEGSSQNIKSGYSMHMNGNGDYEGSIAVNCWSSEGQRVNVNSQNFASPKYNDGEWYHVLGICNADGSGKASLYIDGVFIGESEETIPDIGVNNFHLTVGERPLDPMPFVGLIDEVMIFSRALTFDQIEDIALVPYAGDVCR